MKWLPRKRGWVIAAVILLVAIATAGNLTRERLVITFLGIQDEDGQRVVMFEVESRYRGRVITKSLVYLRNNVGTEKWLLPRWEGKDEHGTPFGGWLNAFQAGTRARIGIPLPAFPDDMTASFQIGIDHSVPRSAIWNHIPHRFWPKSVDSLRSRKTWGEWITL